MARAAIAHAFSHHHGGSPGHHGSHADQIESNAQLAEEHEAHLKHLHTSANLTEEEEKTMHELEAEQQRRGIPLGHYMTYVKDQVDKENSCLELPMTIILLLSFSALAIMHLKQDKVFAVEGALRFDIEENANFAWSHNFGHKTIFDANSIADFWSWLHLGFLPLVVQHSWSYSEDLQDAYTSLNESHPFSTADLPGSYHWPVDADSANKFTGPNVSIPIRDDYLHYNRLIGAIRLRQERSESSFDLCRIPAAVPEELWKSWLAKPCMPADPKYEMTPEVGDAESFGEPARVEWLAPAKHTLQQLQHKVIDMEDGCQQLDRKGRPGACLCTTCSENGASVPWLDERTQRVEIAFVSYNAEYGLLSLTSVTLFFSRGGKIHKFVHVQSSWANQFGGGIFEVVPMVMCDITWITLLGYLFIGEMKEIIKTIRGSKERFWRALRDEYLDHWNLVDWVSMGFAACCVTMFGQVFLETRKVMPEFERLAALDLDVIDVEQYEKMNQNFFTSVEALCATEIWYRMSLCFYPAVVMLRLFKSFAAQGRLAVVTRTLYDARIDMIHFFLVFFSVYFCMVVNSVLIFGQDQEDYSDIGRATLTCFRAMFGDWDWSGISDESTQWLSAVWFCLFVMVMMVILLNFLLAILMDSYSVVKEKSMAEEPLMKQIDTMMRRRSQNKAKERVKLGYIFETYFKETGDERTLLNDTTVVTPEEVMAKVSGLPKNQATRTIAGAKAMYADPEPDYTPEDVRKDLEGINRRTQDIRDEMNLVRGFVQKYDSMFNYDYKTVTGELDNSLPPRRQIVETVRGEISQLGTNISGTLGEEMEAFTQQHRDLETHNRNMLAQMQDTHRVMANIRAQTDAIRRDTQRQAILERRASALQKSKNGKSQGISTASCMAPAIEAAPHRAR
jgi:hypothetical protein